MKRGQLYLWPMWDWAAKKLLLNNEDIRNSILTCLSGVVVVSSEPRDLNLSDQRSSFDLGSVLKALKPREFHELSEYFDFEFIAKKKQDIQKFDINLDKLRPSIQKLIEKERFVYEDGFEALQSIFQHHEILCDLFPEKHPHTVDFLCKTDQNKIITIEFQIAHERFFDKRALYYLCSVFSKQKKLKDVKYENVHPVIAINLLAGEETPEWQSRDLIRYWALVDQISKETMPYLTLIQYNLFKVKENFQSFWEKTPYAEKNKIDPEMLQEWLEFFSKAHKLNEFHQSRFKEVDKAYEEVKIERLDRSNEELPDYIQFAIDAFKNKDFYIEQGKQQLLIKQVKKLLSKNKTESEICEVLDINIITLQEIKQLLATDFN
jgi:predicted transposase/invertase (TIGR01784 family)